MDANYDDPQIVTVTGVNDSSNDGDKPYTITLTGAAAPSAAEYVGITKTVTITNTDNDGGNNGCFISTLIRNFK